MKVYVVWFYACCVKDPDYELNGIIKVFAQESHAEEYVKGIQPHNWEPAQLSRDSLIEIGIISEDEGDDYCPYPRGEYDVFLGIQEFEIIQ